MPKDESHVKGAATRMDFCWYRVEYALPDEDEPVYIVYVCDVPEADEDSIRIAIYRQIYRFSDSLLARGFPIEIKSFTCVDNVFKVD